MGAAALQDGQVQALAGRQPQALRQGLADDDAASDLPAEETL